MMRLLQLAVLSVLTVCLVAGSASAAEPVTLENLIEPLPNRPEEPLAESFSIERAAEFLDSASLAWQKNKNCMTCHTNYLYLMARPAIGADAPAHDAVRDYAEKLVTERWESDGPRWPAEVVMTAAVLAINDANTTGELHPVTRTALDRMWTVQRDDGGFDWLDCDWPPMESDDYFGVPMAALATGIAPGDYAATPEAQKGLEKIRSYLAANPVPSLHHKAVLAWASLSAGGIMDEAERRECLNELLELQRDDGGWAVATLGDWPRGDDLQQTLDTSDGYGTGFVIFIARQLGVPSDDARLERGIAWLKNNQRVSGRWYTRSLYQDTNHFLSHAGTAYSVMALGACGEIEHADAVVTGD